MIQTRRGFFERLASLALGTAVVSPARLIDAPLLAQEPIRVQDVTNDNAIHLPRTYEGIRAIADEQTKVMLAAVTASGGESIAYYTPGEQGYVLDKHVELYPNHTSNFPRVIEYKPGSYASPEVVQQVESGNNPEYHIPVYADAKREFPPKGILVIKPPLDNLGRVQTPEQQKDAQDMHEEPRIRQAKLKMAEYIANEHADLFGQFTKNAVNKHHTIAAKKKYFTGLIKAMFETFPLAKGMDVDTYAPVRNARNADELHDALREVSRSDGGSQASHVLGVSELMNLGMLAVNEAAEAKGQKKVITEDQRELGVLITLLHDVGKTQFASSFMKGYPKNITKEQKDAFTEYFIDHNHDHPVLSMVTMLTYPEEAVTAASHHHGLFRHTPKDLYDSMKALAHHPVQAVLEMVNGIGQALDEQYKAVFEHYSVLKADGNIKPEDLPPLSRMMRVADVAEAITGRVSLPLSETLKELESKVVAERNVGIVGKQPNGTRDRKDTAYPEEILEWKKGDTYLITPDTIDPDYLCFMIDHGVFDKFGNIRDQEERKFGGEYWKSTQEGYSHMNDSEELQKAKAAILKRYHWEERKEEVETKILNDIAASEFIQANLPIQPHLKQVQSAVR